MRILIFVFFLFYTYSSFSADWNFEYLQELNDGCLGTAVDLVSIGEAFEYCGCTTHHLSSNFSLDEIIELFSSGELEGNIKYNSIVRDCNKKIGY